MRYVQVTHDSLSIVFNVLQLLFKTKTQCIDNRYPRVTYQLFAIVRLSVLTKCLFFSLSNVTRTHYCWCYQLFILSHYQKERSLRCFIRKEMSSAILAISAIAANQTENLVNLQYVSSNSKSSLWPVSEELGVSKK